jgi:hypothetical protein
MGVGWKAVLTYVALLQLSRWVGLVPRSIQRLVNDSDRTVDSADALYVLASDVTTAICHVIVSCGLLPRLVGATTHESPTTQKKNAPSSKTPPRIPSGGALSFATLPTAAAMYFWNPLNLIAALDGWHGAALNVVILALAVAATGTVSSHANHGTDRSRTVITKTSPLGVFCCLIPAMALVADACLRPPPSVIRPSLSLRWYLNAEVFPSFRSYFASGISIMGALISASVALGLVLDGRQGPEETLRTVSPARYLGIQAMLWELFGSSSYASVSALWQSCLMVSSVSSDTRSVSSDARSVSSDTKGPTGISDDSLWTRLFTVLHLVVTLMNVAAYQLWIEEAVGNANFFYGMNMLRGAGVCAWALALVKAARGGLTR